MYRRFTAVTAVLVAGLALAACGGGADEGAAAPPEDTTDPVAVATTTMLGSVVGEVVQCAGGSAQTLMPIGADPHDFSPSSEQVAELVSASVVVANGLGLEEGLEDALDSARADGATVLEVAEQVDPIEFAAGRHGHADEAEEEAHADEAEEEAHGDETEEEAHADDEHGSLDPHFWHDVSRMATVAEIVGAELAQVTGDESYESCGTQVHDELMAVDEEVREILATVPDDRRVLVTDHEAFDYFAAAYGFEVAGVVVPGGSTLAEPSSEQLAELVAVVEQEGVPAIFSNTADPSTLVDAVAAEADTEVEVVELYVGSLGPEGSGAETYRDMVLTNAQRIAAALA